LGGGEVLSRVGARITQVLDSQKLALIRVSPASCRVREFAGSARVIGGSTLGIKSQVVDIQRLGISFHDGIRIAVQIGVCRWISPPACLSVTADGRLRRICPEVSHAIHPKGFHAC
jgi:hypothetical protein